MASKVITGAGTSQSVFVDSILLKTATITATTADSTALIKNGAGAVVAALAAKAGTMGELNLTDGANQFSGLNITGPVTVDIVGAASYVSFVF